MNRWKIGLLSALMVLLICISGFSTVSRAAEVTKVSEGEILYIAMQQDMPNLNLFDPSTNTVWKSNVLGWMYEGLLSYTPDYMIYLNLAESYTIQNPPDQGDVATIVVKLRKNITFHDGVPLTAKDVVFSYQVLYFNQLYQSNLQCLYWTEPKWDRWDKRGKSHVGVEAVDDYTVKFHLSSQYPLFFYITLASAILPEHIWKNHLQDAQTGDSQDMRLDYGYGKDTSEKDATIGTGPWKFVDWVPKTYAIIEPYEKYWGKGMTVPWAGKQWPFYPQYVRRIVYKIYSTLDVAILALRQGEVDFIAWSITPGYYEALRDDPRLGFEISTDQGYFYLAFNMRRAPMSDLNFRVAVSHCIDKSYIVDRLMHGYGIKGTVPIAITNPRYINESAIPPEFDLQKARDVLDRAGYRDINGDGWREMPDGSPIKLSILTPPKDYDPIRADAGIMISKNLKNVGLNIESSPTDFGTIVTKAFITVQFDMYILGWALGSFPETYLYDLFHSSQAAPAGYNAPGYSNPVVDKLLEQMVTEMDDEKRIKIIKDIQGLLVKDLPYNVLYYRKNIEAYRKDRWQGWISAFGSIYNGFSINTIHPPGVIPTGPGGVVGERRIFVDAWVPPKAAGGQKIPVQVFVHDEFNQPYADAKVEIYSSTGENITGKTDSNGFFMTKFSMPNVRATVGFTVIATYKNVSVGTYVTTEILALSHAISASVTAEKSVLATGASTNITITVVDKLGKPVRGATVTVDKNTLLGDVDSTSKTTNETGVAVFRYTAPSATLITNRNLGDLFKFEVNHEGASYSSVFVVGVNNNQPSSWYIVNIESISDLVLAKDESATVEVKVTDINGNPAANKKVYIEIGYTRITNIDAWEITYFVDTQNVTVDSYEKTTNSTGFATFTITAKANLNDARFVKVYMKDAYSTCDIEGIYVGNAAGQNSGFTYIGIYSLKMSVDVSSIGITGTAKITLTVSDSQGNPVPNAVIWMKIPQSDFGQPAYLTGGLADGFHRYVGSYSAVITGGNGQATISVTPSPIISDVPANVIAWVDCLDAGGDTLGPDAGFWSGMPLGVGAVQNVIIKRVPVMTARLTFTNLMLRPDTPSTRMTISVVGPTGPVTSRVSVTWNLGAISGSATGVTTAGNFVLTLIAPPSEVNAFLTGRIVLTSATNALNVPIDFTLTYVAETESYMNYVNNTLYVLLDNPVVAKVGESTQIKVRVVNRCGLPVSGAEVSVSGIGVENSTVVTDNAGIATFVYKPEKVPGYKLNVMTFVAKKDEMKSDPTTYGLLVVGKYTTLDEIEKKLSELQSKIENITRENEDLKEKLKNAESQAGTYFMLVIVLIVIIIILGVLLVLKGRKPGAKTAEKAPEEKKEESTTTTETTEETSAQEAGEQKSEE